MRDVDVVASLREGRRTLEDGVRSGRTDVRRDRSQEKVRLSDEPAEDVVHPVAVDVSDRDAVTVARPRERLEHEEIGDVDIALDRAVGDVDATSAVRGRAGEQHVCSSVRVDVATADRVAELLVRAVRNDGHVGLGEHDVVDLSVAVVVDRVSVHVGLAGIPRGVEVAIAGIARRSRPPIAVDVDLVGGAEIGARARAGDSPGDLPPERGVPGREEHLELRGRQPDRVSMSVGPHGQARPRRFQHRVVLRREPQHRAVVRRHERERLAHENGRDRTGRRRAPEIARVRAR